MDGTERGGRAEFSVGLLMCGEGRGRRGVLWAVAVSCVARRRQASWGPAGRAGTPRRVLKVPPAGNGIPSHLYASSLAPVCTLSAWHRRYLARPLCSQLLLLLSRMALAPSLRGRGRVKGG